jgi:hypothetical protein
MRPRTFRELLADPAPGFVCDGFGGRQTFVAAVRHELNPQASREMLAHIPSVPGQREAAEFYAQHNGMRLFEDVNQPDSGLVVFPIEDWPAAKAELQVTWQLWTKGLAWEPPYGPEDVIPFAWQVGAANPLHWVVRGPLTGQIQWWPWTMMPTADDPPLARGFGEFFNMMATDPVRIIAHELGGYARFSDGKTQEDWFPVRYVPDRHADEPEQ